jgi:hypothetical protein
LADADDETVLHMVALEMAAPDRDGADNCSIADSYQDDLPGPAFAAASMIVEAPESLAAPAQTAPPQLSLEPSPQPSIDSG